MADEDETGDATDDATDDDFQEIVDDEPFVRGVLKVRGRVAGKRIDRYLKARFPQYSRTAIQGAIADGTVKISGRVVKASYKIRAGDQIEISLPGASGPEIPPEDIPLSIVYEDELFVVIDKPPHMVVHPSRGHLSGTLVNALVHHFAGSLSDCGDPLRPGILHRLDRDTTGVIMVAKDTNAHWQLARQWEVRTVRKEYVCLVESAPHFDADVVDSPLARHPTAREKMAIDPDGKTAETRYEVVERLEGHALVRCFPKTGRTHQIRVHMAGIACPILCDHLYSEREEVTASELRGQPPAEGEPPVLARQALHARRLTVTHPGTGERMTFEAPLPADMAGALAALREAGPVRVVGEWDGD